MDFFVSGPHKQRILFTAIMSSSDNPASCKTSQNQGKWLSKLGISHYYYYYGHFLPWQQFIIYQWLPLLVPMDMNTGCMPILIASTCKLIINEKNIMSDKGLFKTLWFSFVFKIKPKYVNWVKNKTSMLGKLPNRALVSGSCRCYWCYLPISTVSRKSNFSFHL